MNRMLFYLFALGCALLPASLLAQQAAPRMPVPELPLVAAPQPGNQWMLTVQFPPEAGNAPHPVSASYRCTHEALGVDVAWSNGTSREGYVKGDRVIFKNQAGYSCSAADDADSGLPLFCAGFAGTGWITPADYLGTETVEGEVCFHFMRTETTSAAGERIPRRMAWIRVRDKIPFLVKLGEVTLRFSRLEKRTESLTVPPEVEALLIQTQRQQDSLRLLREINRNAK